jgi:hypothetical protein
LYTIQRIGKAGNIKAVAGSVLADVYGVKAVQTVFQKIVGCLPFAGKFSIPFTGAINPFVAGRAGTLAIYANATVLAHSSSTLVFYTGREQANTSRDNEKQETKCLIPNVSHAGAR